MEDKKQIIPTCFKAKISHALTFPVGAEKVSNALVHAPQFGDLVLYFNSDRWGNVRFHRYACIGVGRSSRRAAMADRFLNSAGIPRFNEWRVDVFPVPRTHRHLVQHHILSRALPEISEWLRKRDELDQPGEESLTFIYNEEKDELTPEFESRLQPHRA
jgi:hypothetical protein